jgi:Holliday junction resolvase
VSRSEREKGARGEREFAELLRQHGFEAKRDGRLEDDLAHNVPDVHFEVKRCERLDLPCWTRQAEADAGSRDAVVAYRKSGEPWRVSMTADHYLELHMVLRDWVLAQGFERGLE